MKKVAGYILCVALGVFMTSLGIWVIALAGRV